MGWKAIRDYYRIRHIVQVTSEGICIGSPYVHDIIVIKDGKIVRRWGEGNSDVVRYLSEMEADPAKLAALVAAEDTFERSIPVYTYEGGEILEKQCEELGWPNVTHDGMLQYENSFSPDRAKVAMWAKHNAEAGIEFAKERVERAEKELAEAQVYLNSRLADLQQLSDRPEIR